MSDPRATGDFRLDQADNPAGRPRYVAGPTQSLSQPTNTSSSPEDGEGPGRLSAPSRGSRPPVRRSQGPVSMADLAPVLAEFMEISKTDYQAMARFVWSNDALLDKTLLPQYLGNAKLSYAKGQEQDKVRAMRYAQLATFIEWSSQQPRGKIYELVRNNETTIAGFRASAVNRFAHIGHATELQPARTSSNSDRASDGADLDTRNPNAPSSDRRSIARPANTGYFPPSSDMSLESSRRRDGLPTASPTARASAPVYQNSSTIDPSPYGDFQPGAAASRMSRLSIAEDKGSDRHQEDDADTEEEAPSRLNNNETGRRGHYSSRSEPRRDSEDLRKATSARQSRHVNEPKLGRTTDNEHEENMIGSSSRQPHRSPNSTNIPSTAATKSGRSNADKYSSSPKSSKNSISTSTLRRNPTREQSYGQADDTDGGGDDDDDAVGDEQGEQDSSAYVTTRRMSRVDERKTTPRTYPTSDTPDRRKSTKSKSSATAVTQQDPKNPRRKQGRLE